MAEDFTQRLGHDAELIEAYLAREIEAADRVPPRLADGMRLATLGGGKRFRPFLVLECASLFDIPRARGIATAAALECVHCYSLVHDDLPAMDNDTLRRGQPTVWAAYDEWTAILVGDALLTLAFEIIARPDTHSDPSVRGALVTALAIAAGGAGMVGGQCLDLQSDKLGEPADPEVAYVRRMQGMKTGALLRFACEAGAILGQAGTAEQAALVRFGDHLGFAFQIADDLLDIEGSAESVGKATGKDAAAGKATLVELLGVERARAMLDEARGEAAEALAPFGARAARLRQAADFVATRTR